MMFKRSLSCAALVAAVMIFLTVGSGILVSFLAKDSVKSVDRQPVKDVDRQAFTQLQSFGRQGSYTWYATVQRSVVSPGALQGPSELLRVDAKGATSTILVDPQPITNVVVSKDATRLAYRTIEGKSVAIRDQVFIDLPSGYAPVSWVDAKTLLVSRGSELFRVSLDAPERLISVPSTSTRPL